MRTLLPRLLIALTISTHAFASPAETARQANVEEDVLGIQEQTSVPVGVDAAAGATNSENVSENPSVFNGISVPPMKELRGETFDKEVKDGYWYESLNKMLPPDGARQALFAHLPALYRNSTHLADAIRVLLCKIMTPDEEGWLIIEIDFKPITLDLQVRGD
ncbi:MAG: hypothetical protein Q9187_005906 [Circinaria calcarea]